MVSYIVIINTTFYLQCSFKKSKVILISHALNMYLIFPFLLSPSLPFLALPYHWEWKPKIYISQTLFPAEIWVRLHQRKGCARPRRQKKSRNIIVSFTLVSKHKSFSRGQTWVFITPFWAFSLHLWWTLVLQETKIVEIYIYIFFFWALQVFIISWGFIKNQYSIVSPFLPDNLEVISLFL